MSEKCAKLSKFGFGMGLGVTWALGVFILAMLAMYLDMGKPMVDLLAQFYKGFDATLPGSAIGSAWGFLDGFVGGFFIAFFYNLFRCGR